MLSIACQSAVAEASVFSSRRSNKIISPAHSGSPCAFCQGAVGYAASDQRVITSRSAIFESANLMAPSTSIKPSGGGGIMESILFLGSATTSLIKDSTSGRASAVGTGVTKPIQRLDNFGDKTGT